MEYWWPLIKNAVEMFLFLGAELSILFILISAAVSLAQQYIPDSRIQALLGGEHGRGYIMAALIGAITPFCSCSTIPMLRGLLKAKAGFGPTMTFLFSSPLLNPIIIGLFVATFGLKVTIAYAAIALIVSVAAGLILDLLHFEKYVIPAKDSQPSTSCCGTQTDPQHSCCASAPQKPLKVLQPISLARKDAPPEAAYCAASLSACCEPVQPTSSCCPPASNASSCCSATPRPVPARFSQKLKLAFQDGWQQFLQICLYLLLGVSLGAVIYGFVPGEFIAKYASGDSIFAVPVAAVAGIPLYVRVEALIPLTAVLVGKGMGLGAVMALIIGGGGASLTEVILLKSMFRMPMIVAFLVVILGMAIISGYFFQYII